MSFIDDLKKEENIYNHSIEDIIILKYIESFKRYLKWNFKYIDKSTEIHGYVKNDRDVYGFEFVKEKLYGLPKCNTGFSDECSCITYFSEMQGCRIKEFAKYDYLYLKNELKKELSVVGLKNCSVNIYINPMMKIERVPVRKIFRKVYETKETVLQENAYCCIYIEGNI